MQSLKTTGTAKPSSDETFHHGHHANCTDNATLETTPPRSTTPPVLPRKRTTWNDLSPAQRKYAKQLHIDEGWSLSEAILLAKYDGGAQ